MKGVEIDFVVNDSLVAISLYEKVFEIEIIQSTNYERGVNEVIFSIYGTRFHMLDENLEYQLKAPTSEHPNTIWFNVLVDDIRGTWDRALALGCTEISPLTDMMNGALTNAIFIDPFGYQWMLHQMHREVSAEELENHWEEEMKENE